MKKKMKDDWELLEDFESEQKNSLIEELNKEIGKLLSERLQSVIPIFFERFFRNYWGSSLEILKTEIIKALLSELETTKLKLEAIKEAARWIKLPGKMDWAQANEMCERLKMRLPTKDELQNAYRAGIMDLWDRDDGYWSSDYHSNGYFYGFNIALRMSSVNSIEKVYPCALIEL